MKRQRLGAITLPSGVLTILDPGHIAMLETKQLAEVPRLTIEDLPSKRALPVWGVRVGTGRWAECWDHVAIELRRKAVVSSKKVGVSLVDFARLLLVDASYPEKWIHNDSIDGKADFVFWGLDAAALAAAIDAPRIGHDQYGWTDLTVEASERLHDDAEKLKAEHAWKLATDLRPHSHHWQALEAARAAPTGSATIEVGDLRVCLFFTSWGDGRFPIHVDFDADEKPVQVRIQLRTRASVAAMVAVNQ